MDLDTFRELLTPAGQAALAAAVQLRPTEPGFLACFANLRKRYPADIAKAALETVLLRQRARAKFSAADSLYFTRESLEQASGDATARHRAERFAPFGVVADLCCGVGGDALALAARGLTVLAVESDPLRAAMITANAAALGFADRISVQQADVLAFPLPGVRSAYADPARRSDGRRHLDPEDYTPPLSSIRGRLPADFPLGVKVAPGIAWADIAGLGAEAEFVSVGGEMKECVLWFGPLQSTVRRATVLPAGATLHAECEFPFPPVGEVDEYVFDPDPAVVRAGLAGRLAGNLALRPVDATVALLTGPIPVTSPFVTTFRVEHSDRVHAARLRDYLRERHVGRVTVVKRASVIDAEEFVKKLKLDGADHRVLILTRINGEQSVVVGERVGD